MTKKIGVVGCGGTGSYLIPVLTKLASDCEIHVFDGDKLEPHNLDRQLFSRNMIGRNKAVALSRQYGFIPHDKYITSDMELEGMDFIFACPDNMSARLRVLEACDRYDIPSVICGNEYESASATYYEPIWKDTKLDYLVRYPESIDMARNGTNDPTHSCTGEITESHPQLPLANSMSASMACGLFHCWTQKAEPLRGTEYFGLLPIEYIWTATSVRTVTINNIRKGEANETTSN